jgi:hypothetical protein
MNYGLKGSILLFLFAVLVISLFSTCSFLYPLNPWDDANVYMTIGNAMLSGKELYVDIFDHKGPMLFFMHEAAAVLSRSSFVGIYLIEILCCFFYLLYSLRTMRLFSSSPIVVPLTCLLGVITYSSDFFSYGDSVEEFSLPFLAQCLYYMLRFVKDRYVPNRWQSFVMGVGLATIFWMKFNILFFYFGAILTLVFIAWRNKQWEDLMHVVLWVIVGIVAVTLPVLGYFAVHGTLDALWEAYFMVNIFHYHGVATNGEPDFWWFPLVKLGIWAVLMLPLVFLRVRWEVKLLVFGTYGVLLFSFSTLTVQFYYFLTIFTFFPLLINYIRDYVPTVRAYIVMALVAILGTVTNWNLISLLNGTFPTDVLEMAEIINANKSEDSEVLTFSSYDTGIYLFTQHLPPNKNYFLSSILDPEIRREQAELVASGKIKYLVREIEAVTTCHEYYDAPVPDNYQLIYDKEELFRYRFITTPHKFLWNLIWPRVLLKYVMNPVTINQRVQIYERRP